MKGQSVILKKSILISILFIGVVTIWVSSNYKWYDGFWKGIIRDDATGYYAYLPATFIYNDLNFNYYDSLRQSTDQEVLDYRFRIFRSDGTLNKYYAGTALLQTPFFLAGHLITYLTGREMNGYSAFYMIAIQLATITYLLAGLVFLALFLKTYRIKEEHIAIILLTMVFGTNIFYYTTSEPGMSHIYSFFLVSAFLYISRKYFLYKNAGNLLPAAILLGLITLVRPVNLLIIFAIPFVAGGRKHFLNGLKEIFQNRLKLFLSISGFVAIVMIQFIIYKIQTGHFFLYSYSGEGFEFDDPDMINILFSYRKGLFVYTPVLFISLAGLYYVYRDNKFSFFSWLAFFLMVTYVLSSWYMWFYGGSFSSRPYIEYFPLFAVPLGFLIQNIKTGLNRKLFIAFLFILMIFAQIQTYQYRKADIHWSEMNREKYWNAFPTPARIIDLFN